MKTLIRSVVLVSVVMCFNAHVQAQCDGQATFTDARDGEVYNQVTIGSQCWMAENLNIGNIINGVNNQGNNGTIERYCYNDDVNNCNIFGGLYQWDEAMQYTATEGVQGVCPLGWHLPTDAEWCQMENVVEPGTDTDCNQYDQIRGTATGTRLKTNVGWDGTNTSGFAALSSGYRYYATGAFVWQGTNQNFWTSSENSGVKSFFRRVSTGMGGVHRYEEWKNEGYSIRCVRDVAPWPLPMELLDFKASWMNDSYQEVLLEWETLSEVNGSHFEIERSIDAINFEYLKSVNAIGEVNENTSYSTIDNAPFGDEISYYRLKQVDLNGDFEYSNIEALNVPEGLSFINLYPNPVVEQFTVLFTASKTDKIVVRITNSIGQELTKAEHSASKGLNKLNLDASELSTGNYFIEMVTESGSYRIERKFIKGKQ